MDVRFHHDDLKFKRFMDLIDEGFKLFASLTAANYISLLRHLPFIHYTRNKISQNRAEMGDFFQDIINEHKAAYDENNIRDVVDAYLYEIQQAKNESRDYQLFQGKNKGEQKSIFSIDSQRIHQFSLLQAMLITWYTYNLMIFNTNTSLNGWSFFFLRRSPNATNYGRSLLRRYGNGEDYPGVVGGFHVTLPGSGTGGAGRVGPGRRKITIALTGGSSLSPDHRRDDSRNPSQIQPCTAGNSARYHTVNLNDDWSSIYCSCMIL